MNETPVKGSSGFQNMHISTFFYSHIKCSVENSASCKFMGALYLSNNLVKSHPASADFEIPKTVQSNQRVRETQPVRGDYVVYRRRR